MQTQIARSSRAVHSEARGDTSPGGLLPAYGALSSTMKDHVYWFGRRGLIFTSPWVVTPATVRHPAVLLLTATAEPVELSVDGRVLRGAAFAIAPLTERGLRAVDVGLVSVNVEADHPCFRAFCSIPRPGVLRLDRSLFAALDPQLMRAYEGRLAAREAKRLFEELIEAAVGMLPGPPRDAGRADLLHELLRENPGCSLDQLARELKLSYTAASHAFSRSIGMPLRTYQHWLKCMRATEQLHADVHLTQIAHESGFADSAHLSRTWRRSYGLAPSYIRDERHVRLIL